MYVLYMYCIHVVYMYMYIHVGGVKTSNEPMVTHVEEAVPLPQQQTPLQAVSTCRIVIQSPHYDVH